MRHKGLLVMTAVALMTLFGGQASAEVIGNCRAEINGRDLSRLSSSNKDDAIQIPWDGTLSAAATSEDLISGYEIRLEYMGFDFKVADGPAAGDSWSASRSVKPYSIFGSGLYKLEAASRGPGECTGAALIEITGKRGATTAAGIAAIAVIAVGGLSLVLSTANAARGSRPGNVYDAASVDDGWRSVRNARDYVNYVESLSKSGESKVRAIMSAGSESSGRLARAARRGLRIITLMVIWVPAATLAGVAGGSSSPAVSYPQVRPRFRISIFGSIGGILLGLGILVLLQQMAILYPTRLLAVGAGVGGLVLNTVLVNAAQGSAARRLNKRIARAEASVRPDPRPVELHTRSDRGQEIVREDEEGESDA